MLDKIWKWVITPLLACLGVFYFDFSDNSEETEEDEDDNGFFFFHFHH